MEWVFPAIAPLWKHGKQTINPKLQPGKAMVANVLGYYEHLCRLIVFWVFCTVTKEHCQTRMAFAQGISLAILGSVDLPAASDIPYLTLTSSQGKELAKEVTRLAKQPKDYRTRPGSPPMERRQLLILRCIGLHLEGKGVHLDRVLPSQLEHIYLHNWSTFTLRHLLLINGNTGLLQVSPT